MSGSIVEFSRVSKNFPGVRALDNISFKANPGEVTAILGENGAGKSTLLKILNGDYIADTGIVILDGEPQHFHSPKDALDKGISIIYQERHIIPGLNVAENIFAGELPRKYGLVRWSELYLRTQDLIDRYDLKCTPKTILKDLSVAQQQMIEIVKDLNRNIKVIALDEPTASLSDKEIEILFDMIRTMRSEGKTIIYVSHRMNEVFKICDQATVLKDGCFVGKVPIKGNNEKSLVSMMVGREINEIFKYEKIPDNLHVVLEVKNLTNINLRNISFKLHESEVLGIAGLVGAGRSELAHAIFGADQVKKGSIEINGKKVIFRSTKDAIRSGIALCPEDRKHQALIMDRSVKENIIQVIINKISRIGFLNFQKEKAIAEDYRSRLDIRTSDIVKKVGELSGGNQQKVVLARWLASKPRIIILDEPTRGIDVGAKSEIYTIINELKKNHVSLILISSELPEILGVCDRIIVMKNGEISGELSREEATEMAVIELAMIDKNKGSE